MEYNIRYGSTALQIKGQNTVGYALRTLVTTKQRAYMEIAQQNYLLHRDQGYDTTTSRIS